jgi:hypothetical protein
LMDYQFVYESGGREIYPNELLNYIKGNRTANVVFTNNKW